jgi:hypothetical protein
MLVSLKLPAWPDKALSLPGVENSADHSAMLL